MNLKIKLLNSMVVNGFKFYGQQISYSKDSENRKTDSLIAAEASIEPTRGKTNNVVFEQV